MLQVDGLHLLARVLDALGDGAQADITANADRMAATLSECIGTGVRCHPYARATKPGCTSPMRMYVFRCAGDAHHKVACAGMAVLAESIRLGQHALQPQLDKLMAGVFGRAVDAKEPVRREAMHVLTSTWDVQWLPGRQQSMRTSMDNNTPAGFANNLHGDVVLSTLTRCLDLVKAVKARQAVLEHCAATAGQICATASPVALRYAHNTTSRCGVVLCTHDGAACNGNGFEVF